MTKEEAINIVLKIAEGNTLCWVDVKDWPETAREYLKQEDAFALVREIRDTLRDH
jgi:hypothetical protein